jgi:hypothetical protein
MTGMKYALWLPLFGALADPLAVARLAVEAEEAGWHGLLVWDHVHWQEYARAGATWWPADFDPDTVSVDQIRGVVADRPPAA